MMNFELRLKHLFDEQKYWSEEERMDLPSISFIGDLSRRRFNSSLI